MTLASVRFGNVLGSRGSFLSVLADQIARDEPVTVTHPDVSRFFMTVEEAVGLVLETAAMAEYAETFVLDMGEPVQIVSLVRNYATQLKLPNVEIRYTGLRPGEKLAEKVFSDAEERVPSAHPKIWATRARRAVGRTFAWLLDDLYAAADDGDSASGEGTAAAARPRVSAHRPPGDDGQRRRTVSGRLLMRALTTAGERVVIDCALPRLSSLIESAAAGELRDATTAAQTIHLEIQADRRPFGHSGWTLVTRGAWAAPPRVLVADACSSGFDLLVDPRGPTLHVTARYRPTPRTRAANMALASRFRLLAAQTLLHYPALWWASLRGRVPLHVSVMSGSDGVTMLAGPGGVGKSTLLSAGLPHGEVATADNLCACDTRTAYGLVEPLRVEGGRPGGSGGSGTHGAAGAAGRTRTAARSTRCLAGSRPSSRTGSWSCAAPTRMSNGPRSGRSRQVRQRGSWSRVPTWPANCGASGRCPARLRSGPGWGRAHPEVASVAAALATRLPCLEVRLTAGCTSAHRRAARPGWCAMSRLSVAVVVTRLQAGAGGVALRGALALDAQRYQTTIIAGGTGGAADSDGSGDSLLTRATDAGMRVLTVPELVSPLAPAHRCPGTARSHRPAGRGRLRRGPYAQRESRRTRAGWRRRGPASPGWSTPSMASRFTSSSRGRAGRRTSA